MKRLLLSFTLLLLCNQSMAAQTLQKYFGNGLCQHPDFYCVKANVSGWNRAFPDPVQRDIVQKVNRTYNSLWKGKLIAIPNNLENLTLLDVSPFPLTLAGIGEKKIIVDQEKLAWAAYDKDGIQVRWGPISSGKDYCPDIGKQCTTQTGQFRFFNKQGSECRSKTYDGARMPYCMFFYKGFAMHGSHDIPGKRASHGCIRMFTRDAKWLNQMFVVLSHKGNNHRGTKVIVRKLLQYN
tara:strand:- start:429 stop:1139 length:711 start_codon:yes stop_codon:yes gene_type:complete